MFFLELLDLFVEVRVIYVEIHGTINHCRNNVFDNLGRVRIKARKKETSIDTNRNA